MQEKRVYTKECELVREYIWQEFEIIASGQLFTRKEEDGAHEWE